MLATALTVPLSGYGAVAPAWRADLSAREYEVDIGEHIVNAVRVMFDATCVHHHRGLRAAIKSRSLDYLVSRNSADFCCDRGRISHRDFARQLPVVGTRIDELLIDEVLFDQYMEHSISERDV